MTADWSISFTYLLAIYKSLFYEVTVQMFSIHFFLHFSVVIFN
jgi:hypothetical protein